MSMNQYKTHWIALYVSNKNITYFDIKLAYSEIKKLIGTKIL